jgi:hypothetical protein
VFRDVAERTAGLDEVEKGFHRDLGEYEEEKLGV